VPIFHKDEIIGGISLRSWQRENAYNESTVRLLQTIANSMSVALENVRLFDETQRLLNETDQRATELQIINNIGQTLTEGLDLQSTLERVGDRLRETLNVDSIGIAAFDPKNDQVIAQYLFHQGKRLTPDQTSTKISKFAIRFAARWAGRSWVVNTDADKYYRKFQLVGLPKSFVMLPLLSGKEIIGGISIADYEKENAFTDIPIGMLETISSNIGSAIQNVRLFDETQRLLKETEQRATELQIINNIGQALTEGLDLNSMIERVAERLHEVLKVDNIAITIINPNTGQVIAQNKIFYSSDPAFATDRFSLDKFKSLMRLSARGGNRSWVMNTNAEKSWRKYAGNVLEGDSTPKSFVALPLLVGKDAIGGIIFADYEKENAFIDLPIRMLETIAYNMGTGIQNVLLFDETQHLLKETEQRATELQIINNIGQTLTEGGDLESMIQRVGERIQEALNINNVVLSIFDKENERVIAPYMVRNGEKINLTQENFEENFDLRRYKMLMRAWARAGGGSSSWMSNRDIDKFWKKSWLGPVANDVPKSLIVIPFVAGGEIIGGISLADYERENAFSDLSVNLLETIASNMGTAVQSVRLFDETQRLLKETEQRATELQIINNIGQTLTEGLDLSSTLERVGERLGEALKFENFGIVAFDAQTELALASYLVRKGQRVDPERFLLDKYRLAMRLASRREGKPWVVNTNAEKYWIKFGTVLDDEIAKSFVMFPLLAGRDLVGSITIADYERENAFVDFPISLIETIASNIGTVIQNVRLFDETQRLLKETDQRATELQIINNIGQTLTEGGDLESMIQRVGERIQDALNINNVAISIFDKENERIIAPYMVRNGIQIKLAQEHYDLKRYKMMIRAWARAGGRGTSWVINKDIDKLWRRGWLGSVADDVPKSLVALPLLAGGEIIGGISLADYEKENAFTDLSVNLLETIASNMGTAVQNVRLFDETKRLFAEAEESRASAVQANKAKSTFLANMSHELRTPLNAIMGFTRIVKKKAEGVLPEKQIENLDKVLISSEHLLGLINTVLDIAKIEAGRMDVIPAKFSVNTLADQCATLASPLLKPNVILEKQVDETIGFIFSDQDKIKQIVLNLLSNAAKFTHEGTILLDVEKSNEEIVSISVTDSGIGISEEALGRVFEEFQQADTSTTREYGGTGLGLAISRNLARLLGGDLTATSELGVGSTFTLTIPIRYEKKTAASSDPKPDSTLSAESQADDGSTKQNGNRDAMKTILIVEDTEFNIDVLTQLLNDDYRLLIAKDGVQGVSMAQENNPDLILMDVSLPVMDGYKATRKIREAKLSIPIIGLSAHAMSGDAEKAREAGCDDYLTKPVDEILLIQKLNQYLR